MKKSIILMCLLQFLLCSGVPQSAIKEIYTITNSTISPKSEFIEPFYIGDYKNITPAINKSSIIINSKNNQNQYTIKFLKHKGWENESDDFTIFEVLKNNQSILSLRNDNGWAKLDQRIRHYSNNDFFIPVQLSETSIAIIIQGFPYPTGHPLLSIIVIDNNYAKLVFNKEMLIGTINTSNGSFSMIVQSNVQTDINEPEIDHLIWKENGILKFKNL